MLDIYDLQRALDALRNAREIAAREEDDRQRAWSRYLLAREHAQVAQEALADAEHEVKREASRLAGQERRPNRDARRAQVVAGLGDYDGGYDRLTDGLPF